MSRRELYRAAKGAFTYLRRCLGLLLLSVPFIIAAKSSVIRFLPLFFTAGAVVTLCSKREVIRDLLVGRVETVSGRIVRRELGDSLRYLSVYYFFLDTETAPKKLVFFSPTPSTGILGLLDSPLILHYLPHSGVIVQVEMLEKPDTPRHRSKEWYRERPQREEELRQVMNPSPCKLREEYWFWEDLFLTAPFILFLVWGAVNMICNWK